MDRVIRTGSRWIMTLLMINVVVAIFLQIIGRMIEAAFSWTLEFACYNFTWLVFFGAVIVLREGKHIQISYFVDKMPRQMQVVLFYFRHILALAVMIFLLPPAYSYAVAGYAMKSAALHLPMLYVDGIVLVSLILLSIETVRQIIGGYCGTEHEGGTDE